MTHIGSNLSIFDDPFNSRFALNGKLLGGHGDCEHDSSEDVFGFAKHQNGGHMIFQVTIVGGFRPAVMPLKGALHIDGWINKQIIRQ